RIWNPESNYNFERKTFRLIPGVGSGVFFTWKTKLAAFADE
ncbi:hypothetical protein HMPREF3039_00379, partial [Akkermansia sp. KLE1798]